MIISYPASPSRIVVLLKSPRTVIEKSEQKNCKKENICRSHNYAKIKGPENLSRCFKVCGES